MALKCLNPKYKGCRALRSAWMIALMGLLRTSEFLVENPRKPNKMRLLCVRDVKWFPDKKNPKWIKIHIRASKTDFWRKGVFIVIGITNCPEFCAVTELRLALEQRFEDRKEWDQKAPLFLIHGHPLSKQRSSGMLKLITEKLGWNPKVYESILRRTGFAHKLFLSKRRCFFNSIEGTTDCLEDHRSLEIGCVQVRPFFHYNTLLSCIISLHRNASRGRAHYVTIPEGNIASLAAAWVPQGPGEEAVGWAEVAGAQGTFLINRIS